ncbi:MAG: YtxH domain-containing protein [Peptostreptococcaceae bacterium]|nr:YtxH domain-containing protein [Peptostreptococcaceae bacterium]
MILKTIFSVVIGGALGFIYYKLVGCPTGSCPITSKPINTIIYGAIMGLLVSNI